eukprot:2337805-Rhodomonas_salina.1
MAWALRPRSSTARPPSGTSPTAAAEPDRGADGVSDSERVPLSMSRSRCLSLSLGRLWAVESASLRLRLGRLSESLACPRLPRWPPGRGPTSSRVTLSGSPVQSLASFSSSAVSTVQCVIIKLPERRRRSVIARPVRPQLWSSGSSELEAENQSPSASVILRSLLLVELEVAGGT